MPSPDTAATIKGALAAAWADVYPTGKPVLHVDDDYNPDSDDPRLLVADDGGPPVHPGAWMVRRTMRRPTIRLTAFAAGRTTAWEVVNAAVDWLRDNRTAAGITRIEDVSEPLTTRDRDTGAYLASITMPVLVRPITT
jgi:hypothetical protein